MNAAERPARPGEYCTCGRPAAVVICDPTYGDTGYCGIPDGGLKDGPCPWCGGTRHDRRCGWYTLTGPVTA